MRYVIHGEDPARRSMVIDAVNALPADKKWLVQIDEYRSPRSLEQNSFFHAVPLRMIADATGNSMGEMKEYLLGEAFGWQESEVMGRVIQRPLRRSSSLNTKEFSWFLEWVEQWASQTLGILVPRPNEVIT